MKESNFANEFKKSCKFLGYFYYKIPDSYGNERFTPNKPFDAFIMENGNFHAIEFKMTKSKVGFSFDRVRPHQEAGLLELLKHGAKTTSIIINYRFKKYNKAFIIPIEDFVKLKEKSTKKSIPFKEIEKLTQIPRIKKEGIYIWDFSKIVN